MPPPKKLLFPLPKKPCPVFPLDKLVQGECVVQVTDPLLRNALISFGIPTRKDPSHVVRYEGGKRIEIINFGSSTPDGIHKTVFLIRGWKNPIEWLTEHPMQYHMAVAPWSFAQPTRVLNTALTHPWSPFVEFHFNHDFIQNKMNAEVEFLAFQPTDDPNIVYHARKGSSKEQIARANGWKQI